jgi:hypothetical protein
MSGSHGGATGNIHEFTPTPNTQGGYLCYVNGLEVPIVGASVSFGVGQVPVANIQFFPSQLLQRFGAEDRVPVVLFYLDTQYEPDNPAYRLLFDGEITGWSYSSRAGARSITATAEADISIMQQMIFNFLNTVGKMGEAASNPGSNDLTQPGAFFSYSLFQDGLLYTGWGQGAVAAGTQAPNIKRPFDLLYNVVKAILDHRVPLHNQSIPIANFFRRWARKQNFHNKFIACPDFDEVPVGTTEVFPLLRAARSASLLQVMQDDVAGAAENKTVFDLLLELLSMVYCEIAMLPTAPCHKVSLETSLIKGASDVVGDNTKEDEAPSAGVVEPLYPIRVANYFVKSQTLFAIPPTCNVVFPSMASAITYGESYRQQPTRIYVNEDFVDATLPGAEMAAGALAVGYPPQAQAALQEKLSIRLQDTANITQQRQDMVNTGMNILVWPEEFFKGPVPSRGRVPTVFGFLIRQLQQAPPNPANPADQVQQQDGVRRLLSLYAEYEYYKLRYAARAGSVDMVWNPYVVPGYPCIIFDKEGGLNQVGYVNAVVHQLGPRGMSTTMNYSFGRTLNEWLGLMKQDSEKVGRVFGSAPMDPFDAVRQALQDQAKAEIHYDTLFHGKRVIRDKKNDIQRAAAVFAQDLLVNHDGSAIEISGPTESKHPVQARPDPAAAPTTPPTKPSFTVDLTKPVRLAPAFERPAKDTASALSYVARPICTLREYVTFLHGGRIPPEIWATKRKEAVLGAASPAMAFGRIKQYIIGPGPAPSVAAAGASATATAQPGGTQPTAGTSGVKGEPLNTKAFPQTRADWDSILRGYIEEVRTKVEPLE